MSESGERGMKYYQCRFAQDQDSGVTLVDVAWIPERGAKVGNRIELKGKEGLWTVTAVGVPGVEPTKLFQRQALDRHSLPSLKS
jgi:hypothetical protein